jgi:hypothetical protein
LSHGSFGRRVSGSGYGWSGGWRRLAANRFSFTHELIVSIAAFASGPNSDGIVVITENTSLVVECLEPLAKFLCIQKESKILRDETKEPSFYDSIDYAPGYPDIWPE